MLCVSLPSWTLGSWGSSRLRINKRDTHVNIGNQSLGVLYVLGEAASPCSVSVVAAGLVWAGLSGDGELPRLARLTVGVLLFSLSFGGVLLD